MLFKVTNWILFQEKEMNIKHCPSMVQALLKCSSFAFQIDILSCSLLLEQISSICYALLNILNFILGEDIIMKEHIPSVNGNDIINDVYYY